MAQRDSQRPRPEEPRSGLEEPASLSRDARGGANEAVLDSSFETPRSARLLRMRSVGFGAILKAATLGGMAQLLLRLKDFGADRFLVLCASAHATEEDKGVLANLISRALSSPGMSVSIGAVNGVLSSDASISDIVIPTARAHGSRSTRLGSCGTGWRCSAGGSRSISSRSGAWSFCGARFLRTLPPPDTGAQQPILPELPVKVLIKQFGVQELSLGEPVVGVAARLNISGKATLGPPSEGLDLTLTAQRLDAPGDFKTLLTYIPATDKLTLT